MRSRAARDGVTLRVVAGTNSVLLAMDLQESARPGCLGFSVERTDLDTGERRWLPNMLRFPSDRGDGRQTTASAPLQVFRWGDYTARAGRRYAYRAVARYGSPADVIREGRAIEAGRSLPGGVAVEVRTEDSANPTTAVVFNRGAAASKAYNDKFGATDPAKNPVALAWLSRGLEEALLAFLSRAEGPDWGLHAVVYEFQKPNLLDAVGTAKARGAEVKVAYHARVKGAADQADDRRAREEAGAVEEAADAAGDDKTAARNLAAIWDARLDAALGSSLKPRRAPPQGAIMHDKYVVLLKDGTPVAVWTGSTNWTEGAIYGQLNVGHAVSDPVVAALYERSFQLLFTDPDAEHTKAGNEQLTPVPPSRDAIPHGVTVLFSPQSDLRMVELYAEICANAKLLLVSAPFLLHSVIRGALFSPPGDALRYVMSDKPGAFGAKGAIDLFNGAPGNQGAAATMLKGPLNDFQGKLLEGRESFHHGGVHVHTKIILVDPFGTDPILVTGSANFSTNSTTANDSNTLILRGDSAVADIYATEFMRMFQHYWFRYRQGLQPDEGGTMRPTAVLALQESDGWQAPFFEQGSTAFRDRIAFAG